MANLREYVQAELNDAICLNQLNGADMRWTESKMEAIVNSIMVDIEETGPDYDLDEIIKWNLDQNLTYL